MDAFTHLILTPNTLFMSPNMNNSVCLHLAGFCLKTNFVLGLGSWQWTRKDWESSSSAHVPREAPLLTVGSVSVQAPPDTGHSFSTSVTLAWFIHLCNEGSWAWWSPMLIPVLRFWEGEKELTKVVRIDPVFMVSLGYELCPGHWFQAMIGQTQSQICLMA